MPKAEWGAKRLCERCGAKFYDMMRRTPACPSCGSAIEAGRGTWDAAEEERPAGNGEGEAEGADLLPEEEEEDDDDLGGVPVAPADGEDEED